MAETEAQRLYLDVMKRSLSYSLWDDPGLPILTYGHKMLGPDALVAHIHYVALRRVSET